jgi:hypothetical protein
MQRTFLANATIAFFFPFFARIRRKNLFNFEFFDWIWHEQLERAFVSYGPVQTFVSPEAIGATVAFLLQICMVYVNTLLVQKGLSEK